MKVLIPAADTVNNGNTLGLLSVLEQNLSFGRPGSIRDPFEFKSTDDVVIYSISVLGYNQGLELVIAGGQDYTSYIKFQIRIYLFEINGLRSTCINALWALFTALTFCQHKAVLRINHWFIGHGLGKRRIDSASHAQTQIKFIGNTPF